jgi:hypothetical protein
MNWQQRRPKQLFTLLLVALLGWNIASCSKPPDGSGLAVLPKAARSKLTEVSPPFVIQSLKPTLDAYQPQVQIVSPRSNQVIDDTEVNVKLQISDLPLYKDEEFELGPYLQVMLDSQPYAQVYDTSEPLTLTDLTPGTHTLRAFAVRPWHESFKNDGAFAQTTFHVFAKTAENQPDPTQPLLTYNAPQDTIGAEPVLLDFYLTNAPLHLVAREDTEDAIPDWQVRCTINGESFTFDRWEPIYLKGLKPGRNWVQLELLDDQGNPLPNTFNNVVQLITYEPGGSDTLARMTRGELTAEAVRKIVDPNYVPPAPEPEVILEPDRVEPDLTEPPVLEEMPPEVIAPEDADTLEALPEITTEPEPVVPEVTPEAEAIPEPAELNLKSNLESGENLEQPLESDLEADTSKNAAKTEPLLPAPIAPIVAPAKPITPAETLPETPQPFQIIIAPEGNAAPVEVKPVTQPARPPDPTLEPALPEPIRDAFPETTLPVEPDPLEAVKARIEEVFQSKSLEQPEAIPLPEQLETTEPEQPLDLNLTPVTLPSFDSLLQPLEPSTTPIAAPLEEVAPVPSSPEFSLQPPEIPDMMSALDRVKGFFENLRKRPDEPTLPLLLENPPTLSTEELPPQPEGL